MTLPLNTKAILLAVDDDAHMRTLIRRLLEAEEYAVHTAPGAAEAKSLFQKLSGRVDLLLTDIAMPGAMGTELAREIRSAHPGVRLLYISRYSREELRALGMDITGNRLLPKPFTPSQLVGAVRDALQGDPDSIAE